MRRKWMRRKKRGRRERGRRGERKVTEDVRDEEEGRGWTRRMKTKRIRRKWGKRRKKKT